jgi:O-methyltransferase
MNTNELYSLIKDYTMCRQERFTTFCNAIKNTNYLEGCIVECGVWKGGMICGASKFAINNNINRKFYAFDSYEGFPEPTEKDIVAYTNESALKLDNWGVKSAPVNLESLTTLLECMNLLSIPIDMIIPIKGWFKDTVPLFDKKIVILRLDGDWYDSTKVCLDYLYDKVISGGIIILDDYGYWKGCKEATDEFLSKHNINITLNKTDFSEVWFIKP